MRRFTSPLQYATALARLPPECRPLGLRIVPAPWLDLVAYMVLVYLPALRRLAAARSGHA